MLTNNDETQATVGAQLRCAIPHAKSPSKAGLLRGAAVALAALLFAPNAAFAAPGGQCGAQTTDGDPNTSDTIVCNPAESYPDGISYSADGGDLRLEEEFEATIDGKEVILMDVQDDGLNVTGTGDDNITFFAEPGTIEEFFQDRDTRAGVTGSGEAVIDYRSESGDIAITAGPVIATGDALADPNDAVAVRAESTAGGNITIDYGPAANDRAILSGISSSGTGIFAKTTGAGTVDITTPATGVAFKNAIGGDVTGIEAVTEDGALSISVREAGSIRAGERGILADTRSGTGSLSITTTAIGGSGGNVSAGSGGAAGIAAIDAFSGTGPMTIDIGVGTILDGGAGVAIRTHAMGDAAIDIAAGAELVSGAGQPLIDMTAAAGTTTTLNMNPLVGVITGDAQIGDGNTIERTQSGSTVFETGTDFVRGAGGGRIVINNHAGWFGGIGDFAAMTGGGITFNNTDPGGFGWHVAGEGQAFSAGDDVINNGAGALIVTSTADDTVFPFENDPHPFVHTAIDFGAGADAVNNAGWLVVGDRRFEQRPPGVSTGDGFRQDAGPRSAETRFAGLEEFHNSGLVFLGGILHAERAFNSPSGAPLPPRKPLFVEEQNCAADPGAGFLACSEVAGRGNGITDGFADDVLSMPGVAFTGGPGSMLLLDAELSTGAVQRNCQDRLEPSGEGGRIGILSLLPGADCLDLRGGSTAGSTQVLVVDSVPGDLGANTELVVIDVNGGESAPEHFTLSPQSDGYNGDALGGAIDKGLFYYPLLYDAATQQHKLVAVPNPPALQMPLTVEASQAAERTAMGTWFERQADLRDTLSGQSAGRGVWGRVTGETIERDVRHSQSFFGNEFTQDNDFDQDTAALTVGTDFLFGDTGGGTWVVGTMLGYLSSNLNFDTLGRRTEYEGAHLGVYGSYIAGGLFVDAALGGSWLQVDHDLPSLALSPEGTVVSTEAQNLGFRAEGGWRFELTDAIRVEPLAGLSYVYTRMDDAEVPSEDRLGRPNNNLDFGSNDSLRVSLGGRLSLNVTAGGLPMQYALTARAWEELEGETEVTIESAGADAPVTHSFDDTLADLAASVSLSNPSGTLSTVLSGNGEFGEDYESFGASLGFRYQW